MDRWKLVPKSTMGVYMLVSKSGEYVKYDEAQAEIAELKTKSVTLEYHDAYREEAMDVISEQSSEITKMNKLFECANDYIKGNASIDYERLRDVVKSLRKNQ